MKEILSSGGSNIFLRGMPTPKVGVLTYYFAIFCRKPHENERIWTGGLASLAPPGSVSDYTCTNLSTQWIKDHFTSNKKYETFPNQDTLKFTHNQIFIYFIFTRRKLIESCLSARSKLQNMD